MHRNGEKQGGVEMVAHPQQYMAAAECGCDLQD
jgi:hypothetical protein